ncbi:Retrovirus-related Pol polyprotein from transposon TNT 1-94 [Vitis vinifera]|uniref:Retrovirus-related Pol polyprotein from transposon TNT 1-94 n=1 Tax=Vitis vinifera TaxID=29760 RepID=A0A438EN70_VITVI|nr:Retrovirus-related Pol polyprotein from transposon TNT 1-94 [Vitis vinifera]
MDKVSYVLAVGSLMYAMVFTRSDIAYSVGVVSRFLLNPDTKPMLVGYTDADMAGDVDSRKSTSRYLITFAGGAVLCQSKYQLFCDSQSAIHIGKNSSFHSRSKRIDVRYHWIRDVLEMKLLQLEKIHTDENGSDMLMKILPREKFELC